MIKDKLTPDIFASAGAKYDYMLSSSWVLMFEKNYHFRFFYSVSGYWWIHYTHYGTPPWHTVQLPNALTYVDELQDFWLVMTGKELEPLN